MARNKITKDQWNEVVTTTKETLFGVEGGDVRFQTGSTTGVDLDDGHLVFAGGAVVFPAGLTVSISTKRDGVFVTSIDFGE